MKKILFLCFIFLVQVPVLQSQEAFMKIITKGNFEFAKSVVQTPDGGYAFLADIGSGLFTEKWLVKTNAFGDTLWTHSFKDDSYGFYCDRALVQTPDGGFSLMVKQSDTTRLLHLLHDGDSLWAKPVGIESEYSLAPTSDHGYLAACGILAGATGMMTVSRLDQTGNVTWTQWFDLVEPGFASSPVVTAIREIPGGGFILAGGMYTPYFTYIPFLFRISDTGDSLWLRTYGPYGDARFISVDVIGDQGFFAGGEACVGSCNTLLMKLDQKGDTLWTRVQYLTGNQGIFSLRTTAGGDVVICGDYSGNSSSQDTLKLLLRCYEKNGSILWDKRIGAYQSAIGMSIEFAADSGLIICGGMQTATGDPYHALLVRTDREGNVFGTGFTEVTGRQVNVYPNPVSDWIHITLPDRIRLESQTKNFSVQTTFHKWRKELDLEVYDLFGKRLFSKEISRDDKQLDLNVSAWPQGMYVLRLVYNGCTVVSEKIVINEL